MEKETLEEAAEKYANKKGSIPTTELEDAISKQGFNDGANWQSKRMYSEEEMRKAIQLARLCKLDNEVGDFVDLSGLTEVCTYGLDEEYSESDIIKLVRY